jgi:hypothetical protein
MHELIDLREGDRNGRAVAIWVCACGQKGIGSLTVPEAQTAFLKHARNNARKAAGLTSRRSRSADW